MYVLRNSFLEFLTFSKAEELPEKNAQSTKLELPSGHTLMGTPSWQVSAFQAYRQVKNNIVCLYSSQYRWHIKSET